MSGRARKASEVSDLFNRAATRPDRRDDPDPGLGAPPPADTGPDTGPGAGAGPRTGPRPGARAYTRPGAGPQAGVGADPDADAVAAARRGLDLTARQYARKLTELGQVRQNLTAAAAALRALGEDEELVKARVLIAGAPPEALQ